MCDHCGCSEKGAGFTLLKTDGSHQHLQGPYVHDHDHHHDHDHPHYHTHDHTHDHQDVDPPVHDDHQTRKIGIETDILGRNNLQAEKNRGFLEARNIVMLNLVSSPGSGKTTLLERTIRALGDRKVYVIEGDQQTSLDAERISATGVPVVQVNTGSGCHLDAAMVYHALKSLNPDPSSLLLVENVGNLVCPALFDLGENHRVLIISVTEGEDKPLKYPGMFESAHLCLINKTDLLPHIEFDLATLKKNILRVNRNLAILDISARTGEGFDAWTGWLKKLG